MLSNSRVFICAPTFREPEKVSAFLESISFIKYRPLSVIISNALPGDESEKIINDKAKIVDYDLRQVKGISSEYWSATINRALRLVQYETTDNDWIVMMNVDIIFNTDIINILLTTAINLNQLCQVGAMFYSNGKVVSSAVKVRSWILGLNRHPSAGKLLKEIPVNYIQEVDFLPSRCLLFPSKMLKCTGLISEYLLPHYGADYEYTHRLIKFGCKAFLVGDARIESDIKNTGDSVYSNETDMKDRVKKLISIKNPSNPLYRFRFLKMTYPFWALPSAIISYSFKTLIEIVLGGDRITRIFSRNESGFS